MAEAQKAKVAVVGSGMAGLVTAWLLRQDPYDKYEVEVFESGCEPSLDIASVSVPNNETGELERIDVPMRAFTEGYYHNLKSMYDYLNVRYQVQPFLFSFSRFVSKESNTDQSEERHHMVHASNNHRFPPIRPNAVGLLPYLGELVFALLCHFWFSFCCLFLPARHPMGDGLCESFDEYLRRIRLPQYYVNYYLLPLMAAVTTCSHRHLLLFPAKDIVGYKRSITSGRQLTVSAGVSEVQRKLVSGLKMHCQAQVMSVESTNTGVRIQWYDKKSQSSAPNDRVFDRVVLAVPPNVVGSVFKPLRKEMQHFPTIPVETIVHRETQDIAAFDQSIRRGRRNFWFATSDADLAHVIHLRTPRGYDPCTEATHMQPCGVMVTSCPLSTRHPSSTIRTSKFTRVLRTPESRLRTNRLFSHVPTSIGADEKPSGWKNGDDGVYLVGSWCWDGMVLLEGCVVSAMRTASALGVEIPWEQAV